MDRMHQLRRSRMGIAVARGVKYGESSNQIIRARQGVLLVPRQVTQIEQPETAVADHESNGFKIFRRGVLLLPRFVFASSERNHRTGRSLYS